MNEREKAKIAQLPHSREKIELNYIGEVK